MDPLNIRGAADWRALLVNKKKYDSTLSVVVSAYTLIYFPMKHVFTLLKNSMKEKHVS